MPALRKLIFETDPYAGLDITGYEPDTQGWGSDDPLFAALLAEVRPDRILEIGTWKGASALHMAGLLARLELTRSEICCVDTWLGSLEFWLNRHDPETYGSLALRHGYPAVYYTFLKNVAAARLAQYITPFPVTSAIATRFFAHHKVTFDLIYVDGSHDYEDVKSDILNCHGLLSARGVLFGDDYGWPGVRRAVGETAGRLGFAAERTGEKWVFRKR